MSLGWGKVSPDDYNKYRSGSRADTVDVGDYFMQPTEVRHIDPSKSEKGLGAYIITFDLGDQNEERWKGKRVECRSSYHPAPTTDGYKQMNEISLQRLCQLVDASNADPVTGGDGMVDVIATIELLPELKPVVIGAVSHREYEGRTFQDVENFRPLS